MPCFRPLTAYHNAGSGAVYFNELRRNGETRQINLPCGQCIGCRLQRANEWATRCMHEAQLHTENAFATLTYEKLNTPSLSHRDWQLFAKRLRKALTSKRHANNIAISESLYYRRTRDQLESKTEPTKGNPPLQWAGERKAGEKFSPTPQFKFYMAGEYGTRTKRPHFHACLFGINFTDRKHHITTAAGKRLYTSETLNEIWGHGFTTIGDVEYESAAYIARYICAKITGPNSEMFYQHVDAETGEITQLTPEYNKMSLAEGIGKKWLEQYKTDVYPHGQVFTRGKPNRAPRYYDKIYKNESPEDYAEMKTMREFQAEQYLADNTTDRLRQKEVVKQAQLNKLIREL